LLSILFKSCVFKSWLIAWINASIIQGSGLGPPSYAVEAFDLHPRNSQNAIMKFADDTYLLVGSTSIGTIKLNLWKVG